MIQVFLTHLVGVFKKKLAKIYSDVASRVLKKTHNDRTFCLTWWFFLKLGLSLLPIIFMFHRTDFGGFWVCCWVAIQQLNGAEKNYNVATSLMLNYKLNGLNYIDENILFLNLIL